MANNIPFQQMGPTVKIIAASANTEGNVVSITANSPCNQYFVTNTDKNDPVFVAYGETANITAVIPDGNAAAVVTIPPYTSKVFTGPQVSPTKTVYARCIGPHANATVYVCPGEGF